MKPLKKASDLIQRDMGCQSITTFPSSCCLNNKSILKEDGAYNHLKLYHLIDLLPYNADKKMGAALRSGLKEYEMLITASLEAVKDLALGDLEKFDPLVGENACEIRAVWIAKIVSKRLINYDKLLKKIITVHKHVQGLLQPKSISKLMSSGVSLTDLCEKENLCILLTLEEIFVIQSFLLTEAKTTISEENSILSICIKQKCDPKKIKRFGDISSSFADNLLSKLRKFIAVASVHFIRDNARKLEDKSLISMLSEDFTVLHNNYLLCTPMFWTYKSVLLFIQSERIPLIICAKFLEKGVAGYRVVDNDSLFFEPDANNLQDLKPKYITEADYNKAACIIQGIVFSNQDRSVSKLQWRQTMLKYPISTVILAGAADHRQYPNLEQEERISLLQNHEYETYRSFAKSEGFSLDNPRTFFIQHVYPSLVGSFVSAEEKKLIETQAVSI